MRRDGLLVGILASTAVVAGCGGGALLDARKGCAAGDTAACTRLAGMYRKGEGVGRDRAKAVGLLSDACNSKEMSACFDLAEMHWHGEVTGWSDVAKGSEAFAKGVGIDHER